MPKSRYSDFVTLARNECCNWFDGGDSCPLMEDEGNKCCSLRLDVPCDYFERSVLPLTHLQVHVGNKHFDNGLLLRDYLQITKGKMTKAGKKLVCNRCGDERVYRKSYCEACQKKISKEKTRVRVGKLRKGQKADVM